MLETRPPTLTDRIRERVNRRRDVAALVRELGEHVGAAARAPENLEPRPCPVCGLDDGGATPALVGPVYVFHRCRGCSLLYAPRLLRHDVTRRLHAERPIYRAYWEHRRADAEAMRGRDVYGALVRTLVREARGRKLAIDVGCGFGKLAAELAPHFERVVGLELNRRTAQVGSKLFGVEIRSERLERFAERDGGAADLIVMNQILEHLADVRGVLATAHRVLRPGGVVWVGIPHGASLGMRLLGGSHPYVATHVHVNLFTAGSLRRLAEETGFVVRSLGTDDQVDLSAADWFVERLPERAPLCAAPAFAVDRLVRGVASSARLPSRLGLGAHLEAVLVRP